MLLAHGTADDNVYLLHSLKLADAVVDAASLLTPEQRARLAQQFQVTALEAPVPALQQASLADEDARANLDSQENER